MVNENSYIRHEITKVVKARIRGISLNYPKAFDIEKKSFQELELVLNKRLTPSEVQLFFTLIQKGQNAVALIRNNQIKPGSRALRETRDYFSAYTISAEALLIVEAFLLPAESYLHYKIRDFTLAISKLYEAVEHCKSLGQLGYPTDARSVHLLRNVSHVLTAEGRHYEAIELLGKLILYLKGIVRDWPALDSTGKQIPFGTKMFLFDQLLTELSHVLAKNDSQTEQIVSVIEEVLSGTQSDYLKNFLTVDLWLRAKFSLIRGDFNLFLKCSEEFYSKGKEYLPGAWNELSKDLDDFIITNDKLAAR